MTSVADWMLGSREPPDAWCWHSTRLLAYRLAYRERSPLDEPDWITESVADDGSCRIRPLTWEDFAAQVQRWVEGL